MPAHELSASQEDYLETIYELVLEKQVARAKDIAKRLQVHKSTVTAALHGLADRKLVNYAPYEAITLTREGRRAASMVLGRHRALSRFFVKVLGVEGDLASEAACKIEHVIPEEVLDRLTKFAEFTERCPRAGARWIRGFGYFCELGPDHGDCEQCMTQSLGDARKSDAAKEPRSPRKIPLGRFPLHRKAKVVRLSANCELRDALSVKGIKPGASVQVLRADAAGESLEVRVEERRVVLSLAEADEVLVTALAD